MNTTTKRSDRETETRAATERDDFQTDVFDFLPTPPARPGEALRWAAVGDDNKANEHNRRIQGYSPCKYGDYPDFYRSLLADGTVKADDPIRARHDLVLMRNTARWAEDRNARVAERTMAQMQANDPRARLSAPGLIVTDRSKEEVYSTAPRRAAFGSG